MRRIPILGLSLAAAALACAEPGDGQGAGVARLHLAPLGSFDAAPPAVREEHGPATARERWTAQRADLSWARAADTGGVEHDVLRLAARRRSMRLALAGPFATGFDQVAVTLLLYGWEDLSVHVETASRRVVRTESQRVHGTGELVTAPFDLPELRLESEPLESIAVIFAGRMDGADLVRLALVGVPPEARLPAPGRPPELLHVGAEARRALGLSTACALEARVDAPPGARLSFSYGQPLGVRRPGQHPELVVRLEPDGGVQRVERFPIPPDGRAAVRWRRAVLELGASAGRALRMRFELEEAGGTRAFAALAEARIEVAGAEPRTVLLVTSDTHRADHLGAAAKGVELETPFLDALAARGVLFEDCASLSNVTVPSHVSLMTGTHPRDSRVVDNLEAVTEDALTLAECFRDAGFLTWAAVSAVHLDDARSGLGQGFDRLTVPFEVQRDSSATLAELSRWLPEAAGLPLFLWLHVFDAHGPYDPPEPWRRRYYPADADPYDPDLAEPTGTPPPHWDRDMRDVGYATALYRSEVSYLDSGLGGLFEHPRLAAAVVAVTADHGEVLGGAAAFDHKRLAPDTLFVPLILAWPGARGGERNLRPVHLLDVGRTLLDLADLGDVAFPGTNLLRAGADADGDDAGAGPRFAISARGEVASVLDGDWFLALHLVENDLSGTLQPVHSVELYDLARDRACRSDLSVARPDVARSLRARVVRWLLEDTRASWLRATVGTDPLLRAQLAALGYSEGAAEERTGPWFDPACACERCAEFE